MIKWQFLSMLALLAAFLFETRTAYNWAYLMLILFFGLRLFQRRLTEQIAVRRLTPQLSLFPGEQKEVVFQVENKSRLPFAWISGLDRIPTDLAGTRPKKGVFSLPGRSRVEVPALLTARQRGVYVLGPIEIFIGDFFGLSTQRFLVDDPQTVLVYPRIYNLEDLNLTSAAVIGPITAQKRIYPDPTKLAGVRPCQAGDPLRTLHWPATARTNSLQVKQFEHTVNVTCLLLLNLDRGDYESKKHHLQTELAVSTAASLSAALLRSGAALGFAANGVLTRRLAQEKINLTGSGPILRLRPRQGTAQLVQILTILAGIETQKKVGFETILAEQSRRKGSAAFLFLVIPKDSVEIVSRAEELVRNGYRVHIFVAGSKIRHPRLLHRPKEAPLQIFTAREKEGARL
ncbi:MAG: DUF58 domain-containing protein [Firmicutes bacterium]|nr:DUF58 domain-containing protein [Bacillota bacterium]